MTITAPRITPSGGTHTSRSGEFRGLTGLRLVAAVWVLAFHFHFTSLAGVAAVVDAAGPLVTAGALGVDLFFVLSGFVIAHTYLDELGPALRAGAAARFVWARFCRVWPLYILVVHAFGVWLAARALVDSDGDIAFQAVQPVLTAGEYVQQLFMVQLWDEPYFDGASWVGSTWSISAEWLAYVLFPVAAVGFHRLRNLPPAALAAAAVLVMTPMAAAYLATGSPYHPGSWAVRILCGFSAGVLALLAVRRLRATERVRRTASALAALLPLLVAAGLIAGQLVAPGRGGAVILLFPLLVGALALADRGPALVLSRPWTVYGGRISYGLYLVHIPVFEVFWLAQAYLPALGAHTVLGHVAGLGAIAASLGIAALAYHLVEEPARHRLRGVGLALPPGLRLAPAPVACEPFLLPAQQRGRDTADIVRRAVDHADHVHGGYVHAGS